MPVPECSGRLPSQVPEATPKALNTTSVALSTTSLNTTFSLTTGKFAPAGNTTQKFRCCGFLCLGTCRTARVTLHCRCYPRGCRVQFVFTLAYHLNDDRYCANRGYNEGDACVRNLNYAFNYKYTNEVLSSRTVLVNGRSFPSNHGSTITLTC